jgi:hypothetical protein
LSTRTSTGEFAFELKGLAPDREYEFRARVHHPLMDMYGQEKTFRTAR